ncbi:MAG: glucosaminidase domain-containing protein [Muribaculaceae bacterium]|nr:glucosaminidase domain-containing protein [Muribaculaceae bacterium]
MASSSQQYVDQYAEYAMEQMRLYGIPASVTLAQGILESANGKSRLAQNENNHFGIKATQSWINNGGRYGLYTDDKPNEKFCSYDSVADSYAHHSRFLKENSRYSSCFALSADDYKGWAWGLDKAGYATSGKYAPSLISVIEKMDLSKYDRMVMEEMAAKGLKPGQGQGTSYGGAVVSSDYAFPLKKNEFMLVTSPFGLKQDPCNPKHEQMHKGIDIKCNNEPLLATEKNGKVIAVNENTNTPGGKSVTIQYEREDGTKMQVYYAHLSSVGVKVGETVNAGQQIGISGNTGTRTTGPHLHLGVKQVDADGKARDIDPAIYLADIASKGNINIKAMHNGTDILEKYKVENPESQTQDREITNDLDLSLTPEDWMKKLLSSEDGGVGMSGMSADPIMDMVITMFTSLMALATTIDNKSEEEKMAIATESALNRSIDLTAVVPSMKECYLTISEGSLPVLHTNDGKENLSIQLTTNDMNRLNLALSDSSLDETQKQQRVSSVIGNMIVNAKMSQTYQQGMSEGQEQGMQLK